MDSVTAIAQLELPGRESIVILTSSIRAASAAELPVMQPHGSTRHRQDARPKFQLSLPRRVNQAIENG
jgi:hypothetical protein